MTVTNRLFEIQNHINYLISKKDYSYIELTSFVSKSNGQSEIRLIHDSGETTILLFNSTFPLQAEEHYVKAIHELFNVHSDISPYDELLGLFAWWFTKHNLEQPLLVGTFNDNERKRIVKRIREIREEKRIEARQLSAITGINPANLSRIEQGKVSTGLDILSKIANALGYKLDFVKQ